MRWPRAAKALPLAALPACAFHPWTPSASLSYWSAEVPDNVRTSLPPAERAAQAWSLSRDDPWAPFSKYTLFASMSDVPVDVQFPDVRRLAGVQRAQCAAARLAASGLSPETLWIADLRGAESVAFGAALSEKSTRPVSPVLTFNNWPHQQGIVPADETLSALVAFDPKLPANAEPSVPVFLLDTWRMAYRYDDVEPGAVDNRYMLGPADFPDAETLKRRGVRGVVYVVDDRAQTSVAEDDLMATFSAYQAAGVPLAMVDLSDLCSARRPTPAAYLSAFAYRVEPRPTFVWQHDLLRRSRGGFGGEKAVPIRISVGFRGSGGGHGGGG